MKMQGGGTGPGSPVPLITCRILNNPRKGDARMPKTVARATAFPVSRAPSEPAASRKTAPLVLIVDPDAGVRRMMAMVLQDSNCRIAGVPDGEAALAEAQDRAPALVLAE